MNGMMCLSFGKKSASFGGSILEFVRASFLYFCNIDTPITKGNNMKAGKKVKDLQINAIPTISSQGYKNLVLL